MKQYNLKELKWYAVDLDGCLANTKIDDDFKLAEPNYSIASACRTASRKGKKIVIYTARHWDDYPLIEKWLKTHKIPFKMIICGKILVAGYVDDRNISMQEWVEMWKD